MYEDNQQHGSPARSTRLAFYLWLGVAALLTATVIAVATAPDPSPVSSGRPALPPEWANHPAQRSADTARSIGMFLGYLLPMVVPVGIVVAAFRLRAGSQRARTVLTVIGVVLALFFLVTTAANLGAAGPSAGGYFVVRLVTSLASVALIAAAIAAMYRSRVETSRG